MCLFPQSAMKNEFGMVTFSKEGDITLPCGKCTECLSKRSFDWATRARHEISLHKENCFLTLTYNEESLPSIYTVKEEFQKFLKRLRKKTKQKLRYMVSHEYGSKTFRPHHHCIIFGYSPSDQVPLKKSAKGEQLFTSKEISSLWTLGFHSIGTANERTAYYIASYALKGCKHTLIDPKTGEQVLVADCMDVSKRPAIGFEYFLQNCQQLIDSKSIIPRYYHKVMQKPEIGVFKRTYDLLHKRYGERLELFIQDFENHRLTNFKDRSAYELYSKFKIDQAKCSDSEFREFDSNSNYTVQLYEEYLRKNHDDYHLNKKD